MHYHVRSLPACLAALIVLLLPLRSAGLAGDPPTAVTIGSLALHYQEVFFDHQLHADYAACSECHHHATGNPPSDPACSGCHRTAPPADRVACSACHPAHPFTREQLEKKNSAGRYHIDIPGLQGAYHLNCLPCHDAIGGPTGCRECHDVTPNREDSR